MKLASGWLAVVVHERWRRRHIAFYDSHPKQTDWRPIAHCPDRAGRSWDDWNHPTYLLPETLPEGAIIEIAQEYVPCLELLKAAGYPVRKLC